jgi:glycosyltransferase involved in cell wall biosynthesis
VPSVSVIVPTYNRASLACEAIESILAQTYRDFEVIVVDDESTDDTIARLQSRYGDKVRCLTQKHQGSPGRNRGIEISRGDYVAFLDSDDLWLPDKLEEQVRLMMKSPPEVGLVYCGGWLEDKRGLLRKRFPLKTVYRGDIFQDLLLSRVGITPSRVLIKRECFDKAGLFDESIRVAEDLDMWLRICRGCAVDYVARPLMIKRHADSHMMVDPERLDDAFKFLDKIFQDSQCPEKIRRLRTLAYARRTLRLMRCYHYMNGDIPGFFSFFLRAFLTNPMGIELTDFAFALKLPFRAFINRLRK